MRQIYKDLVIGFILASFVFAPGAFAKPRAPKVSRRSGKPLYTGMLKTVKSAKKNNKKVKISKFITASKPMFHKTIYRDVKKMGISFWDKKLDTAEIGNDYFKFSFKGTTVFGKYINHGPVAFIINGKALYWKDVASYGATKSRIMEILGVSQKRKSKVSLLNFIISEMWPEAMAITDPAVCEAVNAYHDKANKTCICNEEGVTYRRDEGCPSKLDERDVQCQKKTGNEELVYNEDFDDCRCPNGAEWGGQKIRCNVEPPIDPPTSPITEELPPEVQKEEKKRNPWLIALVVAAIAAVAYFVFFKKDDDKNQPPPVVRPEGWDPEGTTPTPGARDPNANGGKVIF